MNLEDCRILYSLQVLTYSIKKTIKTGLPDCLKFWRKRHNTSFFEGTGLLIPCKTWWGPVFHVPCPLITYDPAAL